MEEKSSNVTITVDPLDDARSLYELKLRSMLEPDFDGQWVAIHAQSGDYLVDRWPGKVHRAMEARHPSGPILIRRIGIADEGLRARMCGEWPPSIANNQRDIHGEPIGGDRTRRRPRGA
jgi:hypothetical protein